MEALIQGRFLHSILKEENMQQTTILAGFERRKEDELYMGNCE
jgi:hypothetical protein